MSQEQNNNQGKNNQENRQQDVNQLLKVRSAQKGSVPDENQLLTVRREKLAALQEAGKDPFQITKFDVTHHSQDVKDNFDVLEGKNEIGRASCRERV